MVRKRDPVRPQSLNASGDMAGDVEFPVGDSVLADPRLLKTKDIPQHVSIVLDSLDLADLHNSPETTS